MPRASWMAVHLEPITFSGERITAGVAIVPNDGSTPTVVSTLREDPLEAVFGQYGKHLFSLAGTVISELQAYLISGGELASWSPRMQGVYKGSIVPTKNVSIEAIIHSALIHSSLFSAKGNDASSDDPIDRSLAKFQAEIKRIVTSARPGFDGRFNRKMNLYGRKGTATISYVGTGLAINLSTLDPTGNATYQCATAQRKITHLLRLRDIQIGHSHDELMLGIWVPKKKMTDEQEDILDAYTKELSYAAEKAQVKFEVSHGDDGVEAAAMPLAKKILTDA